MNPHTDAGHTKPLNPIIENIPAEMTEGRWCCWKLVRNPKGKFNKVPYNPSSCTAAHTTRPATFGTFASAVSAFRSSKSFHGVGRLVEQEPCFWVDLDGCVSQGGMLTDDARRIVDALDTYTELSPSGTGLRIFGLGRLPGPNFNNQSKHVEMYGKGPQFVTITGHLFENRSVVRQPDEKVLEGLYQEFKTVPTVSKDDAPMPQLTEDEDLPTLATLGLPTKNLDWLLQGFDGADRSNDLQATAKILYERGLSDGDVLAILFNSRGSLEIALDHRKQNHDKALKYLWKHHCLPARRRAACIGFDAVEGQEEESKDPLTNFLRRYVYVERGDSVCDLKRPTHVMAIKLSEFKNSTANIRHDVPAPTKTDPDRTRKEPVHTSWLAHPDRKTAHGEAYEPKRKEKLFQDEQGMWWVNCYHIPKHEDSGAQDNLGVFFEHMGYLFPIDDERTWFLDWLAFTIQRPKQRCKVTPLHVSTLHGTGRGWVVELIQILLGTWNCTKTKMDVLCGEGSAGQFNTYLHNSLVCFIEEVKEGGQRWAVSDRIRGTLSDNTLPINRKHIGESVEQIYTHFFMMTNHRDALVLPNNDRRIQVLSGPDWLPDAKYYERLYGWLHSDGPAQLYHWLTQRNLSEFRWDRSSNTPGRRHMIESNRSPTEQLFWEVMEKPPVPALTKAQFQRAMLEASEDDAFDTEINERELLKLLQEHAVEKRQLKLTGNAKARVWILDRDLKDDTRENNSVIREGVMAYGT